jgi:hypothetical protein
MVGEEVGAALRLHLGLVLHVLAAAGEEQKGGEAEESRGGLHDLAPVALKGHDFSRAARRMEKPSGL